MAVSGKTKWILLFNRKVSLCIDQFHNNGPIISDNAGPIYAVVVHITLLDIKIWGKKSPTFLYAATVHF